MRRQLLRIVLTLTVPLLLVQCSDDNGNGDPDAGKEAGPPPKEAGAETAPDDATPDIPQVKCDHPTVTKNCKDDWCDIPAGCFWMGSPAHEPCREQCWVSPCPKETLHAVTFTRGFEIKATEVTQEEFKALMGYNPSYYWSGLQSPVEMVSWYEAAYYCNKLSAKKGLTKCYECGPPPAPDGGVPDAASPDVGATPDASPTDAGVADGGSGFGKSVVCKLATAFAGTAAGKTIYDCPGYRLPTEAEWEYAYRAGTKTSYYNGPLAACGETDTNADAIAWYAGNSGKKTHAVGGKKENAWGVFDMAGNVWEWTHDRYAIDPGSSPVTDPLGAETGQFRTDRGGSCWSKPKYMRAALRDLNLPNERFDYIGLRPVRTKK